MTVGDGNVGSLGVEGDGISAPLWANRDSLDASGDAVRGWLYFVLGSDQNERTSS